VLDEILRVRQQKAKELLATTKISMLAISVTTGFRHRGKLTRQQTARISFADTEDRQNHAVPSPNAPAAAPMILRQVSRGCKAGTAGLA
jgi:transcriptional regulator GlxA family with amidase domain